MHLIEKYKLLHEAYLCQSFLGISFNPMINAPLGGEKKRNLLRMGHFALWKGHFQIPSEGIYTS